MKKVNLESAQADFTKWLDSKRISERKREANKDAEAVLIEAFEAGELVLNDDGTLSLLLIWGTNDGEGVKELNFKNRLTVGERQIATKGIKADDGEGRLIGYIAALTDQPVGVIKKIESGEDYERASSIAIYFL
jgi:hypothetical protein